MTEWIWRRGTVAQGHGVASGSAPESPYPAGTIALQSPFFLQRGLDLSDCFAGTINLDFPGCRWALSQPDWCFEQLDWTPLHPPETFSFWRVLLRQGDEQPRQGWIYYPHPETKVRHFQRDGRLELLAPPLPELKLGAALELAVDPLRCQLVPVARLRARLLEFLKFRVLAAQETFFLEELPRLRAWLDESWPEASVLSDAEVQLTLDQARQLYTES